MTTQTGVDEMPLTGAAFDALPSQAAVVDRDGTIHRTNGAWERFATENGLDANATVGENYFEVCERCEDEEVSAVAARLRAVLAGERDVFEHEYPCHDPDGEDRWFLLRALPFADDHLLVLHIDITERKRAELAVEEHNEELAVLANVLSHDVQNPLNAALLRTESLQESLDGTADPDRDADEHLRALASSLERIDDIVDDARTLAKRRDPEVGVVDLSTSVEQAWLHVDTKRASLEHESLPRIRADERLLMQLFENLFANAVTHGGADVTVTVSPIEPDEDGRTGFAVEDTGPGIDPTHRDAVFETGYTTDGETGTGFGLAIVRRIADAHGWTVETADGDAGARFVVAGVEFA